MYKFISRKWFEKINQPAANIAQIHSVHSCLGKVTTRNTSVIPTCLPLSNWSLYLWRCCLCWDFMQSPLLVSYDLIWFVFFERFFSVLKLWAVTVLSSHQGCYSLLCYVAQSLIPSVFPAAQCVLAVCCNENFCLASSSIYRLLTLDQNFQKTLEWPLLRRSRLCQNKLPCCLISADVFLTEVCS